jgi:energy-coupling factor transporter ATP-binding protein EcfA2
MAKKPTPKSSYVILDEARVFYDQNADTVHLTVKDKEIPEGIHLSLNSERADEKRLRRVLDSHGLLAQSELMKEHELLKKIVSEFNGGAAHMPRDAKNHIPFGFGAEISMSWNIEKDPHLLVIGNPGSGKSVTLQNIAEYVLAYGEGEHMMLLHAERFSNDMDFDETVRNIKTAKIIVEQRYRDVVDAMAKNEEYAPTAHVILIVDDVIRLVQNNIEAANTLLSIVRMGMTVGVHVVSSSYGSPADFRGFYDREKYNLVLDINDAFSATFNLRNHQTSNRFSAAEKALLKKLDNGCGMLINSDGKTLVQIIPYKAVMDGKGWASSDRVGVKK